MSHTGGKNPLANGRRKVIMLAFPVALVALLVHLFFIQVLWGNELGAKALANRMATDEIPATRGIIYDRNNNPLVTNEPASSIYADPKEIGSKYAVDAAQLAPYLGVSQTDLESELSSDKYFVWLEHDLPFSQADQIKKLKLSGIYFLPGQRRLYPQQDLAAQVLGFTGDGENGLTGLEKTYNAQLAGHPGWMQVQVDASGRPIIQTMQQVIPPTQGDNLVLTIDENIQFFVEQALDQIEQTYRPASATIIVMNPRTGGILAMGDRPTFDPSQWQSYPESIWGQFPAVLNAVEPGSLFKIITASAVLDEGVSTPGTRYSYPGYIVVQGKRINDAYFLKDDNQTLAWAFANSYNPVFARLGLDLGASRFYRYIAGFGFGQPTGIDLPGEADGIIVPQDRVTPLDLATMGFGQGIAVTPLQMLTAASAVANGGYLMQPRLVRAIVDSAGKTVEERPPVTVRQVISPATADEVMAMMRRVAVNGTGMSADIPGYSVAGKTGTAQVPGRGGYKPNEYVSSFLGFAPATDPAFGMIVMVDEPKGGQYYGAEVAGPVFQQLGAKILHYLSVPYDQPLPSASTAPNTAPPAAPTIPDLTGYPVPYARQILNQLGFNVYASGQGQLVAALHQVSKTTVTLATKAAAGSGQAVTVPNLSGLSIKMAGEILSALGLDMDIQGSGLATKQNPVAGALVGAGTTVEVDFTPSNSF